MHSFFFCKNKWAFYSIYFDLPCMKFCTSLSNLLRQRDNIALKQTYWKPIKK